MGKNLHITTAAILTTLAIAGCTAGESPTATNTASPSATPSLQPIPQQTAKPQPFNDPVVSATPASQPPVASLIQPTNSKERLIVLQKGRTDPFGQLIEPMGQTNTKQPLDKIKVPQLPPLVITRQRPVNNTKAIKPPVNPLPPKKPVQIAKVPKIQPVLPKVLPSTLSSPKLKNVLPPPPQPETAKAVVVSGVVLIGNVPQAIIKVPDESTSRYVQPGQRLVNGVLVKRIEMTQSGNPTVILEQYGIEVAKQVGEQPAAKDKDGQPSATVSVNETTSMGAS
ncbi:MAG: hypothetical protein ACKO3K_10435 [Cuspidothrix sp.]